MARMIPCEIIESTRSQAEINLFAIFKERFPDDWTVFHSLNIAAKNRDRKNIDAELDFILFHPAKGLLVLEAKGGIITHRDGIWTQNGKTITSPFLQAKQNKYTVIDFIFKKLNGDPGIAYAHAACFPDVKGEFPAKLPEAGDFALTGKDIPYLEKAVSSILENSKSKRNTPLPSALSKAIIDILCPSFEIGMSLSDRIIRTERIIFQLTEDQCKLLDFIRNYPRALIRGCAGSGKTIMAVKKARELSLSGSSVLLMCYNKLLCHRLKEMVADCPGITAETYHDFCANTLAKSAIKVDWDNKSVKYWNSELPLLLTECLAKSHVKFDAVIVDEGQDFHCGYWNGIEMLVKDGGVFYVFYDPNQNLFKTSLKLPDLGNEYVLNVNCRNTKRIFERMKENINSDMSIREGSPEGAEVVTFSLKTPEERKAKLGEILEDLVSKKGMAESRIVIIGGHALSHTCIGRNGSVGRFQIVENGTAAKNTIPYFTYMKFKGCEADAVILLDVDPSDPRWNASGLYCATSRAKHVLYEIRK